MSGNPLRLLSLGSVHTVLAANNDRQDSPHHPLDHCTQA